MQDLEFFFNQGIGSFQLKVYARYVRNGKLRYVWHEDGKLTEKEVEDGIMITDDEIKPIYIFPHPFFQPFLDALLKWAKTNGIQTELESVTQGKLIATEKHLEDMRTNFTKVLDSLIKSNS